MLSCTWPVTSNGTSLQRGKEVFLAPARRGLKPSVVQSTLWFDRDRAAPCEQAISPSITLTSVAKSDAHVYDPGSCGPTPSSLNRISWQVEADTQAEAEAKALAHYKAAYGKTPEQLIVEADRATPVESPKKV
jgi:hypothetical protein